MLRAPPCASRIDDHAADGIIGLMDCAKVRCSECTSVVMQFFNRKRGSRYRSHRKRAVEASIKLRDLHQ